MPRNRLLTLCIVHQPPRVLLGMKKRGFGAGRWNGFGGKVRPDETIEEAVRREMHEEAGVRVKDITKMGILEFEFEGKPFDAVQGEPFDKTQGKPEILEVHIFKATEFEGDLTESEEMRPQWFTMDEVPFAFMWPDDAFWFPLFITGKKFRGQFLFGENDKILKYSLAETKDLV